jgi:hypothetical protein
MVDVSLYTPIERAILRAGFEGGEARRRLWDSPTTRQSMERLRHLGLVEFIETTGADGQVRISMPASLSMTGVRVARELPPLAP